MMTPPPRVPLREPQNTVPPADLSKRYEQRKEIARQATVMFWMLDGLTSNGLFGAVL